MHGQPPGARLSLPWLLCLLLATAVVYQHASSSSSSTRTSTAVAKCRPQRVQPSLLPSAGQPAKATEVHQLAGLYFCYGQLRAVREVLRRWRLFYPDAPIYMVNDGGDPALEGLAAEFGANYTYAKRAAATETTVFLSPEAAAAWVQRLIDAAAMADFVMLVEDDVHILRPISFHTLQHDINGENRGVRLPQRMVKVIERVRGYPLGDRHYGGFGASVMRGSFLRQLSRAKWRGWVKQLFAANEGMLHSDQLLTSLLRCIGGSLGHYPGLVETWYEDYDKRKAAGDIEVVHKEKSFYEEQPVG